MAFRLGFNQQRFGGPPRAPDFGNFRMQFRPGFRAPNPAISGSGGASQPQEIEVKTDSGLLFVSNIDENCPNDLVKDMLDVFGKVDKWTRIQGPDGNFPPFGFCGYEEPAYAIQAILTLNNFQVGTKRLNVKANEKTKQTLVDFVITDRIAKRLSRKALGKELEPDEGEREAIKEVRKKLRDLLYNRDPKLVSDNDDDLVMESGEVKSDEPGKKSPKRSEKKSRKHSRSSRKRSRSRSSAKKSKKRKRSVSSHSTASSQHSEHEKRKSRRKSTPEDKINGLDSDDSDVVLEQKERKREQRRKDEDYLRVLKKFEERERRMIKQHERDEEDEQARKKSLQKEAKKLAQFLEDYDDERDDPKYYKGSLFNKRRHIYEAEREADNRDRQEEAKEIESITKMILSENKGANADRKESHSEFGQNGSMDSSPSNQKQNGNSEAQPFRYSFIEEKSTPLESAPQTEVNEWSPAYAEPSTSKSQAASKVITTLQNKVLSQVNSVFAEEDPDEDHTHVIKKKIKPFEITAQDRIESLTAEERKQMVKELIEAIPTSKEALFEYKVAWDQLDNELIEQRIKPWVEKKIRDYLGDDEPSLVVFVCERITTHSEAARLLLDLAMILDSEAESFMIKLWRLIIFQTEAKKVGLNVNSSRP